MSIPNHPFTGVPRKMDFKVTAKEVVTFAADAMDSEILGKLSEGTWYHMFGRKTFSTSLSTVNAGSHCSPGVNSIYRFGFGKARDKRATKVDPNVALRYE